MVHRKYSPREIALGAAFLLLLLVIVTFYIWYQAEAVQLGYKIGELESQVSKMKEEIKMLEAQKAGLLSLRRIEETARHELGLSDPRADQVFFEELNAGLEKKGL